MESARRERTCARDALMHIQGWCEGKHAAQAMHQTLWHTILLIVAVVVLGSSSSSVSSRSQASAVRSRSAASASSVRHGNCRRGGLARDGHCPSCVEGLRAPDGAPRARVVTVKLL